MDNFPPNSQKAKGPDQPAEPIKRVTSADTVRRKRGLGKQFKDTFIGGDPRSATEYVVFGVIIPEIKDLAFNVMQDWFQRLIFGDSHRPRPSGGIMSNSNVGHVSYNRMSGPTQSRPPEQRMLSRRSRARNSFEELVIQSRHEAEEVIERMFDILSQYGQVSVAHLYELTGIRGEHTDMKWGWDDLRGAKTIPIRSGGYLLDLPDPKPFV